MASNKKSANDKSSVSPAVRIGALILAGLMAAGGLGSIIYALVG